LVAQTLDSSNIGLVWDKFHVYQGPTVNSPYIRIGKKGRKPRCLKIAKHPNPIKRALCFQALLDSGQADSQGDLSRRSGIPRTTITAFWISTPRSRPKPLPSRMMTRGSPSLPSRNYGISWARLPRTSGRDSRFCYRQYRNPNAASLGQTVCKRLRRRSSSFARWVIHFRNAHWRTRQP
jgi:hypothetical protein